MGMTNGVVGGFGDLAPMVGVRRPWVVLTIFATLVFGVIVVDGAADAQVVSCGGEPATIVGTAGADVLVGTSGRDVVWAGSGDDVIDVKGGDDLVCAGAGRDRVRGGDGADVIYGGDDIDYLWGEGGRDTLVGEGGSDRLRGGSGQDIIRGGSGADRIWGNGNADDLFGQGGQDQIWGGSGDDNIQGNWQTDQIWGGDGNDVLAAAGGKDTLYGGPGNDTLRGGDNTDRLSGDSGRDTLSGGNGTDTLVGGAGFDSINGGRHTDWCFRESGEPLISCENRRNGLDPINPGVGRSVAMARANWSSGYIQAQIVHDVLEELGYDVSRPDNLEFSPDLAYRSMADGSVDLWANSWYPGHLGWWQGDLPDGSPLSANLARVDEPLIRGGGLQGLLVTKAWADAAGFTTLEQINADPALYGALDSNGNGKGEIFGCPSNWTCDDIIDSQIAFAGLNNLEQVQAGYDAMFTLFMDRVNNGQPAVAYTWTPTSYFADARPGDLTMWLSVADANVLDDSNPLGSEGGAQFDQRPGFSDVTPGSCLNGPDGCQLGWEAADIEITANRTWLAQNPSAETLLNTMSFEVLDVSLLGVELDISDGYQADVERIAASWIAANRVTVDSWLETARWETYG